MPARTASATTEDTSRTPYSAWRPIARMPLRSSARLDCKRATMAREAIAQRLIIGIDDAKGARRALILTCDAHPRVSLTGAWPWHPPAAARGSAAGFE